MRITQAQHIVPRISKVGHFLQPKELTSFQAWRNLIVAAIVLYAIFGWLTFPFCRDGADLGVADTVFHPFHAFMRWLITTIFS